MRTLILGDIHGHEKALIAVTKAAQLGRDDVLITLGDYVDRGPDSKAVLNWLITRTTAGRLVPLLGNHEWMMLGARTDPQSWQLWQANGGNATLASYGLDAKPQALNRVPAEHWKFLETECRKMHETDSHFYVHAGVYPNRDLSDQTDFVLLWARMHDTARHQSGKCMICGHTPRRSGRPLELDHAICLDTWICGGGWLTCLELETGAYCQSDQDGNIRQGCLGA